ncbi:MAG: helix-turn-helix transcriptional regulator [bacterium]|nr:helix-turn-helix transcriptional regulator [bacterium]
MKRTAYKQEVGKRLESLRKHLRFNVGMMAARMGISVWSYRQYVTGNHTPRLPSLRNLVREYNFSLDWLFFGKGTMFFRDAEMAVKEAVEAESAAAEEKVSERKNDSVRDDPFNVEMEEMKHVMRWVPIVRHSVMGYYQKIKAEQKDIIREELEKVESAKKNSTT